MTDRANLEAAETLFAAWARWDLNTVGSVVADDAVDRRPQSGEEFAGRANIMAMYREVPGPPDITWRSIRGGPHRWSTEPAAEYRDRSPGARPAHARNRVVRR